MWALQYRSPSVTSEVASTPLTPIGIYRDLVIFYFNSFTHFSTFRTAKIAFQQYIVLAEITVPTSLHGILYYPVQAEITILVLQRLLTFPYGLID